jgi:Protein of unknown function (DUF992)
MTKNLSFGALALAGLAVEGCVQDSAQQTNQSMRNSKVYIGALQCTVAGGQGYLIGGSRDANCLFTPETGQPQAYRGTIRDLGIDIGETKPVRLLWKAYSLGSQRGPEALVGTYVGESAAVTADSRTGGNWFYGGVDAQIALITTATFVGDNAGYNIQYAAMTITLSMVQ